MFRSFPTASFIEHLCLILFTLLGGPDLTILYFAPFLPIASVPRIVAYAWHHPNLGSVQLSAFSISVPRQLNTAGEKHPTS